MPYGSQSLVSAGWVRAEKSTMISANVYGVFEVGPQDCVIRCKTVGCNKGCVGCQNNNVDVIMIGPGRSDDANKVARCACTNCAGSLCDPLFWSSQSSGCGSTTPSGYPLLGAACRGRSGWQNGLAGYYSSGMGCLIHWDPADYKTQNYDYMCPIVS